MSPLLPEVLIHHRSRRDSKKAQLILLSLYASCGDVMSIQTADRQRRVSQLRWHLSLGSSQSTFTSPREGHQTTLLHPRNLDGSHGRQGRLPLAGSSTSAPQQTQSTATTWRKHHMLPQPAPVKAMIPPMAQRMKLPLPMESIAIPPFAAL